MAENAPLFSRREIQVLAAAVVSAFVVAWVLSYLISRASPDPLRTGDRPFADGSPAAGEATPDGEAPAERLAY